MLILLIFKMQKKNYGLYLYKFDFEGQFKGDIFNGGL